MLNDSFIINILQCNKYWLSCYSSETDSIPFSEIAPTDLKATLSEFELI